MYSQVQKLFGFNKNVKEKKGHTTKQNPKKITKNPPSLGLFTFVILLYVDVIVIIILFFFSKKWLLSYGPLCPKNLKIKPTTNPSGTTKLTTNPLLIKIGIEHGSWDCSFFFS